MTKEEKMYLRIRNLCGLLGMVLPWLALFSAGIADHPSSDWWWSISATYYQSPALVGVLVPASLVLMCYIGYDDVDLSPDLCFAKIRFAIIRFAKSAEFVFEAAKFFLRIFDDLQGDWRKVKIVVGEIRISKY